MPEEQPCIAQPSDSDSAAAEPSHERFEAILRSISDGVFTIDSNGIITCFNRAAEEITGFSSQEAVGQPCRRIFRSEICRDACALRYTMETGNPIVDMVVYVRNADDEEIPVSISTALFRDKSGAVIGGVETFRDLRVVEEMRRHVEERYTFGDIISRSHRMRQLLDILPTIAESDSTVLITGESGTGKELIARALHERSERRDGPFVAVNSAGIPDALMEAEIFGHEAGAFTGATKARPGRFARAEGGTIFLDEIGDLPMQLQAKVLRVLQDGTYEPLGSVRPRKANARVVTATNKNLGAMVEKGSFRLDLYYRINVFELKLPPLRERMEDVSLLVNHFIRRLSTIRQKRINGVSPGALKLLMSHDYPGNVRELENAVEHGFVLSSGTLIHAEHLPHWLQRLTTSSVPGDTLMDVERSFIASALESNHYDRLATARQLGIHKTTLYRKIRKLGIQLPKKDGRSSEARLKRERNDEEEPG